VAVFVEASNISDVLTMPFRHATHRLTLGFTSMMVPLEWNWSEFSDGAELAVSLVHGLLGKKDLAGLRELASDSLLQELRKADESMHCSDKESWAQPPRLLEVVCMALYSSSAQAGDREGQLPCVRVVPLMRIEEEYHYEGEAKPRKVRRLLKWEFERKIEGSGPLAWQLSQLGDAQWFCHKEQGTS